MATREELLGALRKADAAGDSEAAKAIAKKIQSMQGDSAVDPTPMAKPEEQRGGFVEGFLSVPEVGASMVTDLPARAVGGIAGLVSAPFVGADDAAGISSRIKDLLDFDVKTEEGKRLMSSIASIPPLAAMSEFLEEAGQGARSIGDITAEKTGSPLLGSVVSATGQSLPEIAELMLLRSASKGEIGLPDMPQSETRKAITQKLIDRSGDVDTAEFKLAGSIYDGTAKAVKTKQQKKPLNRVLIVGLLRLLKDRLLLISQKCATW